MNQTIDINFINPFLIGASMVFNTLLHVDLQKGKLKLAKTPTPSHDVIILIHITGKINGIVAYSFTYYTVNKIAEILMPGLSDEQIKSEYKDIVGELANMITGNALNILSDKGLEISTPTVIEKENFELHGSNVSRTLVVLLYSPFGQMEVTVAMK